MRRHPSKSLLAAVLAVLTASPPALADDGPTYTIRWAQIHLPSSAADRAAFEFAERVEAETDGDVKVEVLARTEYEEVAGKRRNAMQIVRDVTEGELEMTQAYTHVLARYHQPLRVLGMPYLFRDYDHAEQVFNSPLGAKFTDDLAKNSKLKGFGITYSGGMGVISTQGVDARDPAALDEMRIMISRGRYARMAFLLGGSYVVVGPDGLVPLAREGLVDAAETTVSCFDVYEDYQVNDVVNETHHFLLTSMIISNKAFYEQLPEAYQEIVSRVAAEIVVQERKWSIESTQESRAKLQGMGITFHDLTQAEKDAYKARLEPLYGMMLNPSERARVRKIRAVGLAGDGLASLEAAEDSVVLNPAEASDGTPAGRAEAPAEPAAEESAGGCRTAPAAGHFAVPLALLVLLGAGRRDRAG